MVCAFFSPRISFRRWPERAHLDALAAADTALMSRRRSAGRFREQLGEEAITLYGGAAACATEDGMSFGPWATPARTRRRCWFHGTELAVGFHEEPEAVVGDVQGFGEFVRALEPSMPRRARPCRTFTSTGLPSRVSAPRTMYCPWPSGWMADTRPRMYWAVFLDGAA